MSLPWFKFYSQDFLGDPKIKHLSPIHQLIWIYLLCIASQNNGRVEYLTEEMLAIIMGIQPTHHLYELTKGAFVAFKRFNMITLITDDNDLDNVTIVIKNFEKRQKSSLSSYERLKRYREKRKIQNHDDNGQKLSQSYHSLSKTGKNEAKNHNDNKVITDRVDETREDKIRIDNINNNLNVKKNKNTPLKKEKTKVTSNIDYLRNVPSEDILRFSKDYGITPERVKFIALEGLSWLESTGREKKYVNFRAFLTNQILMKEGKKMEQSPKTVYADIQFTKPKEKTLDV